MGPVGAAWAKTAEIRMSRNAFMVDGLDSHSKQRGLTSLLCGQLLGGIGHD
jgi:hypothetical protein